MKKFLIALAMIASAGSAMAQITITIGQPNFYGPLNLGEFRAPPVYYNEPILIERTARQAREPMYLRVPPGHMKKWGKHCSRYNACGRQVYFVRDEWYTNTYAPRYRETSGWRGDSDRGDRNHRRQMPQNIERGGVVHFESNDDGRGHGGGKHDKHDKRDKHDKHDKGDKGHGKHKD
jgi:hypothetical protein